MDFKVRRRNNPPQTSPSTHAVTHANSGNAFFRPSLLFTHKQNNTELHAIRSAVRLPRASQPCSCSGREARDVVKPSSVPDGVRAKCSESCGLW